MKLIKAATWSFKIPGAQVSQMAAPCMDPEFSGLLPDRRIEAELDALRAAGFDTLMIEGVRRLMLYEHEGRSAEVRAATAHAVGLAHRRGFRVFAHTTASFAAPTLDGFSEAEKSMLAIDGETGRYAYITGWNGWYLWCINHPDFRREYYRLAHLFAVETGVDGFMTDEVYFRTGWKQCVCPHCRGQFGRPIPETGFFGDFTDADFRAWLRFRMRSVGDFYAGLRAAIGGLPLTGCKNREPEPTHSQYFGENNDERMRGCTILFTESCTRELRRDCAEIMINFSAYAGLGEHYAAPVLAICCHDPADIEFGFALRLMSGMGIWATPGTNRDRSLGPADHLGECPAELAVWHRCLAWLERYPELDAANPPEAGIALLLSGATRDFADQGGMYRRNYYVDQFYGWGMALDRAHLPYRVITENDLTPEKLAHFRVLILPNAACLPEYDFSSFRGQIIATGETGRFDEHGALRPRPLFANCRELGVFDVEGLENASSIRITAPETVLTRAVRTARGTAIHLLTPEAELPEVEITLPPPAAKARLVAPDLPGEIVLSRRTDGAWVSPGGLVPGYAVILWERC